MLTMLFGFLFDLLISGIIAGIATLLDYVFHIIFIPGPLSPTSYFIIKFVVGFGVAFIIKGVFNLRGIFGAAVYGIISGVTFAYALLLVSNVGTAYTFMPHLAHIVLYFVAYYIVDRYIE